jgi:hypothetical protein
MRDAVGIELKLNQNLESQLKIILPMLEKMEQRFGNINKTLAKMQDLHDKATRGFNAMGHSIDRVTQKEKALARVNSQVANVGMAAKGATRSVDILGASLGALTRLVAPLMILQKLTQGAEFLGGSALDFEKESKSLQQIGLSKDFQKKLIGDALRLGSSGQYALSGADFIHTFKETRLSAKSDEDARKNLPMIGAVDMKLRMIDKSLAGQANLLPRYFEKFGAFTDPDKNKVANDLVKVMQASGGTVNMAQLLQQIGTSGTAVIGSDPLKEMTEQAYSIKESAAGAGGGGRGRGGVGRQALDRIVNLGIIPPAMATMMQRGGMMDGLTGSSGHKILYDSVTGQHVLTSGRGGGSGSLKTSDVHSFLLTQRPEWMKRDANDTYQLGLDFAAGADILGGNKIKGNFLANRDAQVKHFMSRPVAEQKQLEGQIMAGSRMTGIDFIMERSVGRYLQQHDIFTNKVNEQQGLGVGGQLSVSDRWDKMIAGFTTFGNSLGANENLIKLANAALDNLDATIKILNDNVKPIGDFLAQWGKLSGQAVSGAAGAGGMGFGITGAIGNIAVSAAKDLYKGGGSGVIGAIINSAKKNNINPVTAIAYMMHESGLNPFAIGDKGTSFGLAQLHKGGELGNLTPGQAFDPTTNANRSLSYMAQVAKAHPGLSPGHLAAMAQRPANPGAYAHAVDANLSQAQIIVNNYLDGKQIASQTTKHVAKALVKSGNKSSQSASEGRGSYTPSSLNAGGAGSQH